MDCRKEAKRPMRIERQDFFFCPFVPLCGDPSPVFPFYFLLFFVVHSSLLSRRLRFPVFCVVCGSPSIVIKTGPTSRTHICHWQFAIAPPHGA
jgi:hypothetical protein